MKTFTEASKFIEVVEFGLLNEKQAKMQLLNQIKKVIWLPIKFLKMGINIKLNTTIIWIVFSMIFMWLGIQFAASLPAELSEIKNMVLLFSSAFPIFLLAFPLPSIYGNDDISEKDIEIALNHLKKRNFSDTEMTYLKESVSLFESRTQSKIKALKWVVGLFWAGYLYMSSYAITNKIFSFDYLMELSVILLITVFAYLAVWSYEAAINKLFRIIDFSCHDFLIQRAENNKHII
ncbi:MAG: hypothetical protein Q4G28_04935 [Neisseria sp.]|nr:hypothetical protein [Neisseria sp.]